MLLLCFLSVPQQCKLVCTLLVLDIPILSEGIDQIVICPIMSFFMKAHIKSVYFKIKKCVKHDAISENIYPCLSKSFA